MKRMASVIFVTCKNMPVFWHKNDKNTSQRMSDLRFLNYLNTNGGLLSCYAVLRINCTPMLQRNILPQSSAMRLGTEHSSKTLACSHNTWCNNPEDHLLKSRTVSYHKRVQDKNTMNRSLEFCRTVWFSKSIPYIEY
jgi:hypothetical protein